MFVLSGVGRISGMDDIIGSSDSIRVFSHFFFYLCIVCRVYITLCFFYDIVRRVSVFYELVLNTFTRSSSERIIFEGDEEFFTSRFIVSTDGYETIMDIIDVFVFSLVTEIVSYEVAIGIVEETSGEGASGYFS